MENILDEIEDEFSDINENNLLTKIWIKPNSTLKYILTYCPQKNINILFLLGGIVRSLDIVIQNNIGEKFPMYAVILIAFIMGGLLGLVFYYFLSWLMSATGTWLDGNAEPEKFRTILAWSLIPNISSVILLIPGIIIMRDDLFKSGLQDIPITNNILMIGLGIIGMTLNVWSLVILTKGVSIIQGFKTGKAILNVILPVIVFIVLIVLIVLLFSF